MSGSDDSLSNCSLFLLVEEETADLTHFELFNELQKFVYDLSPPGPDSSSCQKDVFSSDCGSSRIVTSW